MTDSNAHNKKVGALGSIGVGGVKCPCCGPTNRKSYKQFMRSARRRAKIFWKKEIRNQLKGK